MVKMYVWRGALGDTASLEMHQEAMDSLVQGTYAPRDLEILIGHRDIFSYRLNRTERLLFTTLEFEGHRYLLLLEHLPSHDYKKSRFLRSGVLNRYLENHVEALAAAAAAEETFEPLDEVPEALQGLEAVDAPSIILDFYKDEFIQLSDVQEEVLQARLPVVISGVAGSGKSCVAMGLLSDDIQRYVSHPQDEPRKILYVTEAFQLARAMERAWQDLPVAQNLPPNLSVEFKTYEELLQTPDEINNKTLVDRTDFDEWYTSYFKKQQHVAKITASGIPHLDAEALYQEFRICSAFSEEAYYALGDRQSTLPKDKEEVRHAVYDAYKTYITGLDKLNRLHPSFHTLGKTDDYDLIVVDESQDLSHLQLKNLALLAKYRHVAFCMDSHQSLHDALSKRPFLLEMLKRHERDAVSHIELPVTYRCPVKIARVADILIQAKYHLTGGAADKKEAPTVVPHVGEGAGFGHVLVIDPKTMASWAWLNQQAQGAHFAVVTMPEFMESAARLFPRDRLFTPFEIKGLEYDTIVVFHPFLTESMKKTARLMEDFDLSSPKLHRRKADEGNDQFVTPFNELLTSVTRAKQTLVICEEDCRETRPFLSPLRVIMGDTTLMDAEHQKETTTADWEAEILRQVDEGHFERAKAIYRIHLKQPEDTLPAFLEKNRKKESPPSLSHHEKTSEMPEALVLSASITAPVEKKPEKIKKKKTVLSEEAATTPSTTLINSISGLLNDFTEKRLAVFLNVMPKIMSFETTWFETPICHEDRTLPLIQHMLFDPKKIDLFIQSFLKNRDAYKNLDSKKLMDAIATVEKIGRSFMPREKKILGGLALMHAPSVLKDDIALRWLKQEFISDEKEEEIQNTLLYFLSSNMDGIQLLTRLFEKHCKIFTKIPSRLLSKANPEKGIPSPLYWMTRTESGQKLLSNIFQKSSRYLVSVPSETWFDVYPNVISHYANTSPFFNLSGTNNGIATLCFLLATKPCFGSLITIDALTRTITDTTNYLTNSSSLYYLTSTIPGIAFLELLHKMDSKLLAAIPASAWATPIPDSSRNDANRSPLLNLSSRKEGQTLLRLLFDINPTLFTTIPIKAWTLTTPPSAGTLAQCSPFYYLCLENTGTTLLLLLCEKNPAFIESISDQILTQCPPNSSQGYVHTSPLLSLSMTTKGQSVLYQFIDKKPELLPLIASELPMKKLGKGYVNTSLLYFLTSTTEGVATLLLLLDKVPELIMSIPTEAWTMARPHTEGPFENLSPLYYLTMHSKGLAVLDLLIKKNPKLIQSIPTEAWIRPRTSAAQGETNRSPLYNLLTNNEGIEIFLQLLKLNPTLITSIPLRAWTLPRPEGIYINTSPLYCLTCIGGYPILKLLMDKNPALIRSIPADAWTLALPSEARSDANRSPLFNLICSTDSIDMLHQLLQLNPTLITSIPLRAWTLARPESSGKNMNTSALYYLTCTAGFPLLRLLLDKNPELIRSIPTDAWTLALPLAAEHQVNRSPIHNLCSTEESQILFYRVLKENPTLITSIPASTWMLPRASNVGDYSDTTPLYLLSTAPQGINILHLLFDKNPKLIRSIDLSTWIDTYPNSSPFFNNAPPLYYLCSNGAGHDLMRLLSDKDPKFIASIPRSAWTRARPASAKEHANLSPLYFLTSFEPGIKFFNFLFEKHPELILSISMEDWILPRPQTSIKFTNRSPLYNLTATSNESLIILLRLLKENPTLITSIPTSAWILPRPKDVPDNANTTPLYYLASMVKGRVILQLLFEKNPELITAIPLSAWLSTVSNPRGKCLNANALYYLSANDDGHPILRLLFDKNPEFITSTPTETWTLAVTEHAGKFVNTTPLYYLTSTVSGINFLTYLFEKNPALIMSIPAEAWVLARPEIAETYKNYSALYWLSSRIEGHVLLLQLFKQNPGLLSSIPTCVWTLACADQKSKDSYLTALAHLSTTKEGLSILEMLVQSNPEIKTALSPDILSKIIPPASVVENPNAFFARAPGEVSMVIPPSEGQEKSQDIHEKIDQDPPCQQGVPL